MLRMLGSKSGVISLNSQGDILWARGDLKWASFIQLSESGGILFLNAHPCGLIDNTSGKLVWAQEFSFSWIKNIRVNSKYIVVSGTVPPEYDATGMSGHGAVIFLLGKGSKVQDKYSISEAVVGASIGTSTKELTLILVKKGEGTVGFSKSILGKEEK